MTDIQSLYNYLRQKGIIKSATHLEYEPEVIRPISPERENGQELENPAQTDEVVSKNKKEYQEFKGTLNERDLADFNFIFNE